MLEICPEIKKTNKMGWVFEIMVKMIDLFLKDRNLFCSQKMENSDEGFWSARSSYEYLVFGFSGLFIASNAVIKLLYIGWRVRISKITLLG